jgi:hypothetical protein
MTRDSKINLYVLGTNLGTCSVHLASVAVSKPHTHTLVKLVNTYTTLVKLVNTKLVNAYTILVKLVTVNAYTILVDGICINGN